MHPVLAAFPSRPLTVTVSQNRWLPWVLAIGGVLLFGAGAVWLALDIAPALFTDLQISGAARQISGGRISNGRCTTHQGIFTDCDVTLSAMVKGRGEVTRAVHYLFTGFHTGDYTAVVMADPAQPALLTTDIGLDRMWSRVGTFIFMAICVIGLIGGSLLLPFLARRRATMLRGLANRPLVPEVATFLGAYRGTWNFRDARGAKFSWQFGAKFQPFLLAPYVKGQPTPVLAVTAPGVGGVVPLDADLATVDLTDEERRALIGTRNASPPVVLGGAVPRAA